MKNIILIAFITLVNSSCYTPSSLEAKNTSSTLKTNQKEVLETLKPEPVKESQSPKKVTTVEIAQKNLNLEVGKSLELNAMVTLETGEKNAAVEWVSGDNAIITVNNSGKINALKKGTVTIRAIALQDNKTFAECIVTVMDLEADKATVVQINNTSNNNNIFEKETLKLSGIVKYANGSFDSDLLWKSSDDSIASVSNDGLVTALRKGEIIITCISKKDTKIFDNYIVKVIQKANLPFEEIPIITPSPFQNTTTNATVSNIKIVPPSSTSLNIGASLNLSANITMSDNTKNNLVIWSSSDTSIAKIDTFGNLIALNEGLVMITATSIKDTSKRDTLNFNLTKKSLNSIVFASKRNGVINWYSMNPNGTGEERYNSSIPLNPYISPDGTKKFSVEMINGKGEIFISELDGSNKINVSNAPDFTDEDVNWSPDSKKIVFRTFRHDDNIELYTVNADGSDLKRITTESGTDTDASFTSDGRILFVYNETKDDSKIEIYIMNSDGTNRERLTNNDYMDRTPYWIKN